MNEERIQEAKNNIKNYLDEGLVKKQSFNKVVFDTYMKNYQESLFVAQKIFNDKTSMLRVIVTSYYSMFYIANAYLKDSLVEQLIEQYDIIAQEALSISENLIENFEFERVKRSRIQYEMTQAIKESKANTSLQRAKEFGAEIEKLLEN
ncbi:MAG: hypothetical protein ACMXYB_04005 [Candidatus Woesearchaeota archaeon]